MRFSVFALLGTLLLAGCTDSDWDGVMNYSGLKETGATPTAPRPVTPPPATITAEPANADFCRSVATQDASSNGFDQPTQQRVFARSYAQCMTIYTR